MPLSISDPKITFKNLIKSGWLPANTFTITPGIHTGFVNPQGDQFQVCFPTKVEVTAGASGYNAMAIDGPVSWRLGTLPIMLFAKAEIERKAGANNPKKVLHAMVREVERIVHANVTALADFEYISVVASRELDPDVEENTPTKFGHTVLAQYEWRKTLS